MSAACRDCKWWKPLVDSPESWGTCDYGFPFLPFWVKIQPYGAINPEHRNCPVFERGE